ncbi:MAG: NAD(P)-dependent oxidoreductase [Arenicellales bacterium]
MKSEVGAFDFEHQDLAPLQRQFPGLRVTAHENRAHLLDAAGTADYLLTWEFEEDWYPRFSRLKAIFTPAAGRDWVAADPEGRVELIHGTFHGRLLAESLLGAMLFMNRRMPDMIMNFERREWDRNIQKDCRLLANQTVLIIGLGHIGGECARMLKAFGTAVIGVKRDPSRLPMALDGVQVRSVNDLESLLPKADHVAVILPGDASTDRTLDERRLRLCKPGVFIYNFGRGNAIAGEDIVKARDHIGGAFLDVVDEEPLPPDSPLWSLDHVMITPHSSCVYREYKEAFIEEVISCLTQRFDHPASTSRDSA